MGKGGVVEKTSCLTLGIANQMVNRKRKRNLKKIELRRQFNFEMQTNTELSLPQFCELYMNSFALWCEFRSSFDCYVYSVVCLSSILVPILRARGLCI